ncbi:MAG: TlyA family RNA methyltransferase [Ruminococcus sp.]|nr:TlyA family RNA methyltransferase [Ruminococcus sp.]
MRLDSFLHDKGLVKSRERAKKIIISGNVSVNGSSVTKPSSDVCDTDDVVINDDYCKYVGRGGLKLEGAIKEFSIDITGLVCADIGASTGGFTDCMLQNGAKKVYAVDVGHGQLDGSLRDDKRVVDLEGVNVRYLEPDIFDEKPSFISCDLSFISLKLVMEKLIGVLADDGSMVVLIKPQFEVGRSAIGKNGIVNDKKAHIRMLDEMLMYFYSLGIVTLGLTYSSVTGGDGNIEYLAYLSLNDEADFSAFDTKELVDKAFKTLK